MKNHGKAGKAGKAATKYYFWEDGKVQVGVLTVVAMLLAARFAMSRNNCGATVVSTRGKLRSSIEEEDCVYEDDWATVLGITSEDEKCSLNS